MLPAYIKLVQAAPELIVFVLRKTLTLALLRSRARGNAGLDLLPLPLVGVGWVEGAPLRLSSWTWVPIHDPCGPRKGMGSWKAARVRNDSQ